MTYSLRHVRAFVAVAERLHFRRAADALGISQPALTRTVKELEASLGVALLARSNRSVALTAAGAVLLREARPLLERFDRAGALARMAADGRSGRLTVAYMDFAINGALPAHLQAFCARWPEVEIDLLYMPTDRQKSALVSGEIDVGFLIGPFDAPGIARREFERQRLVALVPEQHRLARKRSVSLEDLAAEPFVIGSERDWSAFRRIAFDKAIAAGTAFQIVQEASSSEGVFALVAAGVGVSIYAESAAVLRRNGVRVRRIAGCDRSIAIVMAWHASGANPAARRFSADVNPAVMRGSDASSGPAKR